MPKKKVTTTVEETEVPETPSEYKELHDTPLKDVIAEAHKPAPEEPSVPTVFEEPKKVDEKPKEDGVEFDPVAFKKETAQEITTQLVEALQGKNAKETKENIDEYEQYAKDTWEKAGRPPTYTEALKFVAENTKKALLEEQKSQAEKAEEARKAHEAANASRQDEINKFIDKELEELYADGKLPKIKDPKDPNDYGVIARKALFQTMLEVNQKNQAENKPYEYSVYKIFHRHYKAPAKQPAGADAPVSAGSNRSSQPEDDAFSYKDIKKPWHEILRGR